MFWHSTSCLLACVASSSHAFVHIGLSTSTTSYMWLQEWVNPTLYSPLKGEVYFSISCVLVVSSLFIYIFFPGVTPASLLHLMSHTYSLRSLSLREASLLDDALYAFMGSSLEYVDVSETMVRLHLSFIYFYSHYLNSLVIWREVNLFLVWMESGLVSTCFKLEDLQNSKV